MVNPISQDPELNPEYPSKLHGVIINSFGESLNGRFFQARGGSPHPTVLLLHGFPGHELNLDLAQTIRRAGWNVLVFHYRGSWGSQGNFSFNNCLEDVLSGLTYLRDEEVKKKYLINSNQIVLLGHSLGGFLALMTAIKNPYINQIGSIAGVNLGVWAKLLNEANNPNEVFEFSEDIFRPLQGATIQSILSEIRNNQEKWDITRQIDNLSNKNLLLVAGSRDEVVPIDFHHNPLVQKLKHLEEIKYKEIILNADHSFSDKRIALAQAVIDWLN